MVKFEVCEDEIEIFANKKEIERSIEYLNDILEDRVPNEAIFVQSEPLKIVRVSLVDD